MMHLLGYCRDCSAMYPSPVVTDGLCPICQRDEDERYANDPTPYVECLEPREFSRAAMRERLGVSGNEDE